MFDFKKGHMKEEKNITSMENNKGCWMKGIVILVKVDEMYNILKSVLAPV